MKAQPLLKTVRHFSIQWQVLIIFTIVSGVMLIAAYFGLYKILDNLYIDQLRMSMGNTLNGMIAEVDAEKFKALVEDGLANPKTDIRNDERYSQLERWLIAVYRLNPSIVPYAYIHGSRPGEVLWIGFYQRTTSIETATVFLKPHFNRKLTEAYEKGFSGETFIMHPYTDERGTWVSAFAPIKDSQGNTVGVMAIDHDASQFSTMEQGVRNQLLVGFGIAYNVLFILFFTVSQILNRPYIKLAQAAEYIGRRDYKAGLRLLRERRPFIGVIRMILTFDYQDEIDILTYAFMGMVTSIQKGEETIRKANAELEARVAERT